MHKLCICFTNINCVYHRFPFVSHATLITLIKIALSGVLFGVRSNPWLQNRTTAKARVICNHKFDFTPKLCDTKCIHHLDHCVHFKIFHKFYEQKPFVIFTLLQSKFSFEFVL